MNVIYKKIISNILKKKVWESGGTHAHCVGEMRDKSAVTIEQNAPNCDM